MALEEENYQGYEITAVVGHLNVFNGLLLCRAWGAICSRNASACVVISCGCSGREVDDLSENLLLDFFAHHAVCLAHVNRSLWPSLVQHFLAREQFMQCNLLLNTRVRVAPHH